MISNSQETEVRATADQHQSTTLIVSASPSLLRLVEVQEKTKLSRSSIYAKLDPTSQSFDPTFPIPIRTGSRSVRWLASEIFAWIASRPRTRLIEGAAN